MTVLYRAKQLVLLSGDFIIFYAALWLGLTIRLARIPSADTFANHLSLFSMTFVFWIVINYINGLYDPKQHVNVRHTIETALMALVTGVLFFYLLPTGTIAPKTILLLNTLIAYSGIFFWRVLYRRLAYQSQLQAHVIFVGWTKETQELIALLEAQPLRGYHVEAVIDTPERLREANLPSHIAEWSDTTAINDTQRQLRILVIAPHIHKNEALLRAVYKLLFSKHIQMNDLTSFYESMTGRIPPSTFSKSWFLEHLHHDHFPLYYHTRRCIDWIVSITVGVFLIILFPLIALLIKLSSPGPILIKQTRVGRYGKIFTMYKFRSMYALSPDGSAETHGAQFAQKKDARITPIGKWLRKMRIDELPQIWNVMNGDLTLIGPRPERPEIVAELEKHMPYYSLRHIVHPGLTGWALIHQDYTDTMETTLQKLQYDLYYIKNQSLLLDLSIALKTVDKIIRLKGQ